MKPADSLSHSICCLFTFFMVRSRWVCYLGLCLPFWWNRLRALPGALIHLSSPYVSPPPPRKLRARKHSHCLLFLKTGIFSFLEAQLPFLKTKSPFKGTINYLNRVQNLKLKSKKRWPLSFTSRSIAAVQEVPSSYSTVGLLAAVTTRQSSPLGPGALQEVSLLIGFFYLLFPE